MERLKELWQRLTGQTPNSTAEAAPDATASEAPAASDAMGAASDAADPDPNATSDQPSTERET